MDHAAARKSLRSLPHRFVTKHAQPLRLQVLSADLHGRLVEMYLAFQPRNSFQGLPPLRDEVCVKWVEDMIRDGVNIVAVACGAAVPAAEHDRLGEVGIPVGLASLDPPYSSAPEGKRDAYPTRVVGHIALFPINASKAEMLVVVSPEYQNLGVGTELTRSCLRAAAELGFERVWLPVAATNVRARRVYEKCGFTYASHGPSREVDMVCDVTPYRRAPQVAELLEGRLVALPLDVALESLSVV